MKKKSVTPMDSAELRRRAEERLKEKPSSQGAKEKVERTEEDAQRLIQELQIHQIELEMQNEELAKSRAEVEEGLALYTELYDFAPAGYFTLDSNGVIRRINLTGARLLGLERAQLIGRLFNVFISQGDLNVFNSFLKNIFKDQTKQTCEVALRRKEKASPSPAPSYSSLMGETDELIMSIEAIAVKDAQECRAVMTDITEHRRVESIFQSLLMDIHTERTRLSALINTLTEEVWFADTQKRITLANTSAYKSISLDPKQTIGVNELANRLVVLRPDGSTMPVKETPLLRALLGEVVINEEQIIKLPQSGELRYNQVNAAPVKDSDGIIIGSVVVIRDITELKHAEEQIRKLKEELELYVRDQTE